MKIICNSCGAMISETDAVCPICGTPTVHAQHPDDKKLWEQENAQAEPPAFEHASAPESASPTPRRTVEPVKKKAISKAMLVCIAALILLLLVVAYLMVSHMSSTPAEQQSITQTTDTEQAESQPRVIVRHLSGAEADSIMKMHMAEMAKMEQMMDEMLANDPFSDFDPFEEEMQGDWEEQPQRYTQKPKQSTPTKIRLAGRVGADQYVMVLNAADQSNITGTAAKVVNGKEQTKYRLLGIGSGSDLTVSIYKGKNEMVGTLSGTYNGYTYTGTFTTEATQAPFQLIAQ
ncbi:MAG: hypothetical protein ACI30R_00155 [Sodaliphilus sp.]